MVYRNKKCVTLKFDKMGFIDPLEKETDFLYLLHVFWFLFLKV